MIYSVWDWNKQRYDIFESPQGEHNGQRPVPRVKVNAPGGRGRQLEALLPILPKDAVSRGHSEYPKGRIAIHWSSSAVGLSAYDSPFAKHPWVVLGLILGGVWLGHKALLSIARRI